MTASDRSIRSFLLRGIPDGARVLDVGCGSGWAALLISRERPSCTVHGADSDAAVVRRVNWRARRRRRGAAVRCYPCAAEDLVWCFGRGRYDVAMSIHALHHYAEPLGAVRNLREVVRRGGRVLIAEFEPRYGERLDNCPRYSLDKIVELCSEAGLTVMMAAVKRPGIILVTAERQ